MIGLPEIEALSMRIALMAVYEIINRESHRGPFPSRAIWFANT